MKKNITVINVSVVLGTLDLIQMKIARESEEMKPEADEGKLLFKSESMWAPF